MISIQIKSFLLYTTSEYNTITTMDSYTNLFEYKPDTDSQYRENMNTSGSVTTHLETDLFLAQQKPKIKPITKWIRGLE